MNYFAIKHKPTGKLMPQIPRGQKAGGTRVELQDKGPPRLFVNETAAKNALRWWLGGVVTVSCYQNYEGDYDEGWQVTPKPERKAEEMEIIRVEIQEIEPCLPFQLGPRPSGTTGHRSTCNCQTQATSPSSPSPKVASTRP
jgi:hypothetical protein